MLPIRVALIKESSGNAERRDVGGDTSAPLLGALLVCKGHMHFVLAREGVLSLSAEENSIRLLPAAPEHLLVVVHVCGEERVLAVDPYLPIERIDGIIESCGGIFPAAEWRMVLDGK
jgi:hypothetical protein